MRARCGPCIAERCCGLHSHLLPQSSIKHQPPFHTASFNSWHMALDHQRNRVLRVDLFVGVVSLCAVLSSMPAAYLGEGGGGVRQGRRAVGSTSSAATSARHMRLMKFMCSHRRHEPAVWNGRDPRPVLAGDPGA